MAPRAYWTGNLKLSLVSFPVRVYNAVTEVERVRLHQVHKGCNQRLKFPPVCPVHGQVDRSEVDKAYEFEPEKLVVLEREELDKIKLRTEKTIELTRFIPSDEAQDAYFDGAYYVAPDGPLALEPFRVIREALAQTKTSGIGRVAFSGRERAILLRGQGHGFVLTTLHAAAEVRPAQPYFEEIAAGKPDEEHLRLAISLIESKMGNFDPSEFRDRYQDALVELVRAKVEGGEPAIVQEPDAPTSYNFMEALRRSLGDGEAPAPPKPKRPTKKPAAASVPASDRSRKRKRA